jgi:tetratricopeptide (TPR) repeat protein
MNRAFTFLLIVVVVFTMMFSGSAYSLTLSEDSTRSVFEKGLDQIKLQKARHFFLTQDYDQALNLYKELQDNNGSNALINYRLGECKLYMKNYDEAILYFEKAIKIAPDAHKELFLNYGKTFHKMGEFDKALEQYNKFSSSLENNKSNVVLIEEARRLIEQVNFAKSLINSPIDVDIKNMGDNVNSKYDEYGPSISADGKTLIFSSRRPDTKGGQLDPNDKKYMEDIYMCVLDSVTKLWAPAEPVPGRLNSEDHDGCLSISPDGEEIYVYKNEGDAGSGAGDIYVSKLSSTGKWGTPKPLGKTINTTYFESSASVTADGNKLFFISERKGGLGQGDIYYAEKVGRGEWGEAKNIGPAINTADDERMVFVHPSGQVLFFSSDGHKNTIGGYDLFMSTFENNQWSAPVNIGYPINTVDDEVNFTLTSDNKKAYIASYKTNGFGGIDIYEIDLSRYDILNKKAQ